MSPTESESHTPPRRRTRKVVSTPSEVDEIRAEDPYEEHGSRARGRNERGRRDGRDRDRGTRGEANPEISDEQRPDANPVALSGIVTIQDDGSAHVLGEDAVAYVPARQTREWGLRGGDEVMGAREAHSRRGRHPALIEVLSVSGMSPEVARQRPRFEDLTPLFPDERLRLESGDVDDPTGRIIDLVAPIGKGQRGLIVSPPKAGKTMVMRRIAQAIEANHPEVRLIVLLVDERPEEVTDMRRQVRGEVVASTFDRPAAEHVRVAEATIERAKRMVEMGRDVVIILDGITRMTRAYNMALPPTGRIMSGGVDSGAIYPPKKFFGAARNVEEGGSLTILATALVETGSRMDEVIFEEFKGTGNMELRLDRRLAERRLYPAIDVNASSTRHEELLFQREQLNLIWKLRRVLNALTQEGSSAPGLELLIDKIRQTRSNADFLGEIAKSPNI